MWVPGVAGDASGEIQVIDLFSGGGGMSLGFAAVGSEAGGFRVIGAGDLNDRSLETYEKNFDVPALSVDVRELADEPATLVGFLDRIGYDPECPSVLIGCAPCQGFTAHRKRNWDIADDRNDLIGAFARVVETMGPTFVVMENVPELLAHRYWQYFESFRRHLVHAGYNVAQGIYNAAAFGTPQERFRAVVLASQLDFMLPSSELLPEEYRTVRDAIGDLPPVAAGERPQFDRFHKSARHRASTIEVIQAVPKDGGNRPSGIGPACLDRVSGYYDVYGRLAWDKPAITITHYARNPASGRFTHPEQDRGLTMREAARLQGFPDAFEFVGTFDDVFRQIGEAVPPPLAVGVARSVLGAFRGTPVGSDDSAITSPVNDSYAGVIAGIKARR